GLWIYNIKEQDIVVYDNDKSTDLTNILSGWNFLGSADTHYVEDISCKNSDSIAIWKFSVDGWQLYAPKMKHTFPTFNEVNANDGFWVYCK
ncbi:MAG: hypothetical protein JXQ66_07745, partial [Campylobacterales bacterium]|nr:hypothetical protein [Campylobacterales bacterium]